KSLKYLRRLALGEVKADPTLRVAAVNALGALARYVQDQQNSIQEILDVLSTLVREHEQEKLAEVCQVALVQFADFADVGQARLVFGPLTNSRVNMSAVFALQKFFARKPQAAEQVVKEYLHWRVEDDQPRPNLRADPDEALVGM